MITIWNELKHFEITENWGEPDKMNGALLLLLDTIRDIYDESFVVHYGYATSGHCAHSQHYIGNAVDFHIDSVYSFKTQIDKMLNIFDILQVSDRVGFGIYPNWNNPGFHLDLEGKKARWGRIRTEYVSFEKCYTYIKNMGGK